MKIPAIFKISRPANCAIAAMGAFAGAYASTGYPGAFAWQIAFAIGAAIFATAGGNALNDYFDEAIDRINKPRRPIPSGALSKQDAFSFAVFSLGAAIALATMVNWTCAALAAINVAVLASYNWKLKKNGFIGNAAIAYLVCSVFLFGGASVGNFQNSGLLAAMAALSTLGREIFKDIEDMKGDAGKRKTLPMKIGAGYAGTFAAFATLVAVALSPIPFFLHRFNALYMLAVAPADALFMYSLWLALGKENWPKSQKIMKIAMLVAVLAFIIGRATIGLGV